MSRHCEVSFWGRERYDWWRPRARLRHAATLIVLEVCCFGRGGRAWRILDPFYNNHFYNNHFYNRICNETDQLSNVTGRSQGRGQLSSNGQCQFGQCSLLSHIWLTNASAAFNKSRSVVPPL